MSKGTAGKKALLSIDAFPAASAEFIATTNIPLADAWDTAETTEQGDDAEAHIQTIQRTGLDVEGNYRPGDGTLGTDQGQTDLQVAFRTATENTFVFYPLGNVSGDPRVTFVGITTSFPVNPNGPGGVVSFTSHVQASNATPPVYDTVP